MIIPQEPVVPIHVTQDWYVWKLKISMSAYVMLDRCAVKAVTVLVLTSMPLDLGHESVKVIFFFNDTVGPGYNITV